jgi:excisionase family DNA binding protein
MEEKIDQHAVAKYLGVSTKTVRNLIKRGELPPQIRIGRKRFWLKGNFSRWLEGGGGMLSIQNQSAAPLSKLCGPRRRPVL